MQNKSLTGYLCLVLLLMTSFLAACGGEAGQTPVPPGKAAFTAAESARPATTSNVTNLAGAAGTTPLNGGQITSKGETAVAVTPVSRTLVVSPARSFKYASLDFTVASGIITDGGVSNSANPATTPGKGNLNLKLSINNQTKEYVQVEAGLFQLKLANNLVLQKPGNLSLQARDTKTLEFDFEVPLGTSWDGAQFSFGELNKEPVSIALIGPVVEALYPTTLSAGGEANTGTPKANYKVTKVIADLDGQGQRAGKGNLFLIFSILVTNQDKQIDAFVGENSFRLVVDGVPQATENFSPTGIVLASFGKQEFLVTFQIPQSVKSVNLEVGETDKETATIPLDLTEVKPAASPTLVATFASAPAVRPTSGVTPPPATVKRASTANTVSTTRAVKSPTALVNNPAGASSGKSPQSGEEVCALVTKEEASRILAVTVDKAVPSATTGYACNYYSGEQFLFQIFFEKIKVPTGYLNSTKVVYPDAKQIPGVGDNNWWSAESSRYEIEQGGIHFAIPVLTGEPNKDKLLGQATEIAKTVITRLKVL